MLLQPKNCLNIWPGKMITFDLAEPVATELLVIWPVLSVLTWLCTTESVLKVNVFGKTLSKIDAASWVNPNSHVDLEMAYTHFWRSIFELSGWDTSHNVRFVCEHSSDWPRNESLTFLCTNVNNNVLLARRRHHIAYKMPFLPFEEQEMFQAGPLSMGESSNQIKIPLRRWYAEYFLTKWTANIAWACA